MTVKVLYSLDMENVDFLRNFLILGGEIVFFRFLALLALKWISKGESGR